MSVEEAALSLANAPSKRMNMIEAINDALDIMMERDPNVVVMGEDVGYFGGVFRATAGLHAAHPTQILRCDVPQVFAFRRAAPTGALPRSIRAGSTPAASVRSIHAASVPFAMDAGYPIPCGYQNQNTVPEKSAPLYTPAGKESLW